MYLFKRKSRLAIDAQATYLNAFILARCNGQPYIPRDPQVKWRPEPDKSWLRAQVILTNRRYLGWARV